MLGPIVPGECRRDLRFGSLTASIAMCREMVWVSLPFHDVPQDPQAVGPRDVADDDVQLQVHLHERLLHAVDGGRRALDQRLAVTQVAAQGRYLRRGPYATPRLAPPLARRHDVRKVDWGLAAVGSNTPPWKSRLACRLLVRAFKPPKPLSTPLDTPT